LRAGPQRSVKSVHLLYRRIGVLSRKRWKKDGKKLRIAILCFSRIISFPQAPMPPEVQEAKPKSPIMTIGEAENLFDRFRTSLQKDYSDLARVFEKARHTKFYIGGSYTTPADWPVPSSNYLRSLGYLSDILMQTHHSFNMVTGSDRLLQTESLQKHFRDMLKRLAGKQNTARVIVVDGEAPGFEKLQSEFADSLKVVRGRSVDKPIQHFLASDDRRVRDEEHHGPLTSNSDANAIKAEVYFNNETLARLRNGTFENYWKKITTGKSSVRPLKKRGWIARWLRKS